MLHSKLILNIYLRFFAAMLALAGMTLALNGCAKKKPETADDANSKLSVFVSIPPQSYIVKRIGGGLVEVHTLVAQGSSPHTFEVTPRQLTEISRARAFFTIGMPFEKVLIEKIKGQKSQAAILDMTNDITWRRLEFNDEHESRPPDYLTEEQPGILNRDSHVWLGIPQLARLADNTARALTGIDTANAAVYDENLQDFMNDLLKVDARLKADLAGAAGQTFYVHHPAFGYFADSYQLKQTPLEIEGKNPSPKTIAKIIETARREGVKVILVQPQFDPKTASAVADAIDGTVVSIDPLAEDILKNLRDIGEKVREALSPDSLRGMRNF